MVRSCDASCAQYSKSAPSGWCSSARSAGSYGPRRLQRTVSWERATTLIAEERARYGKLIRDARIKPD